MQEKKALLKRLMAALVLSGMTLPLLATAADMPGEAAAQGDTSQAMAHAMEHDTSHGKTPAGLYGSNMVKAGEVKFNLAAMYMRMRNNYIGSTKVSPETIATTVPSNVTMTTPTGTMREIYRIVPTSMNVETLMASAMYGLSDDANLMAMVPYVRKSMTMLTFAGSTGTTVLGQSTATTEGVGDASASGLWRFHHDEAGYAILNLGFSLPTGSTTKTATMLSPMNQLMTSRASYGMQPGTGTVDALPGLTYFGRDDHWSWGTAYRGRFALRDNSEGYRYGNRHELDLWQGYTTGRGVTLTGRVAGYTQGAIRGADPKIGGLMQGSNPAFYGGTKVDVFAGLSAGGAALGIHGANLSLEAGYTVYQHLNGPQLGSTWQAIAVLGAVF